MESRYVAVTATLVTALVFIGGAYAAQIGPFEANPSEPAPEVQSLTITDRGCRGEISDFAGTSNGPGGKYVFEGVTNTSTPAAALTAKAVRTSAENAEVITYRVDLQTHNSTNASQSCSGEIAYRLVVNAPSGPTGSRVGLYLDGQMISCGGGTSGSEIGCYRLSKYDERPPNASTNGSIQTASPTAEPSRPREGAGGLAG